MWLKRQLSKIHNSSTSIDTTQSARNLGFIFDEHLSFSDQISALSKSCYHHIRALRCIRPYLDLHTAKTVATSIVHSKLDYCNSLYYGLPKFQINRLQHIQNALARTIFQAPKSNTSLLFWNLFTGLKFLNELNIKSSFSTKFSIPLSLRIYMTLNLFSLLTVTTRALHLMSLSSNHHHHSKSLIDPSDMLHLIFGTSSYITQNSSSESFIPLSATFIWTCQFNLLHSAITFHHFFMVSLWVQNLPFQKILSSTLVCFCLLDWSHGSRQFTGLICSSVLCFSSIFFCFSYS